LPVWFHGFHHLILPEKEAVKCEWDSKGSSLNLVTDFIIYLYWNWIAN